jgi:hypothetical protein
MKIENEGTGGCDDSWLLLEVQEPKFFQNLALTGADRLAGFR